MLSSLYIAFLGYCIPCFNCMLTLHFLPLATFLALITLLHCISYTAFHLPILISLYITVLITGGLSLHQGLHSHVNEGLVSGVPRWRSPLTYATSSTWLASACSALGDHAISRVDHFLVHWWSGGGIPLTPSTSPPPDDDSLRFLYAHGRRSRG
ncbi:hypothetical protein ACSBR2_033437 [Camellia fascicularis]